MLSLSRRCLLIFGNSFWLSSFGLFITFFQVQWYILLVPFSSQLYFSLLMFKKLSCFVFWPRRAHCGDSIYTKRVVQIKLLVIILIVLWHEHLRVFDLSFLSIWLLNFRDHRLIKGQQRVYCIERLLEPHVNLESLQLFAPFL